LKCRILEFWSRRSIGRCCSADFLFRRRDSLHVSVDIVEVTGLDAIKGSCKTSSSPQVSPIKASNMSSSAPPHSISDVLLAPGPARGFSGALKPTLNSLGPKIDHTKSKKGPCAEFFWLYLYNHSLLKKGITFWGCSNQLYLNYIAL
jgi:hypothetical protein